jgi:cytosine/adenosine deaminase-related metal-dependent hydrolase
VTTSSILAPDFLLTRPEAAALASGVAVAVADGRIAQVGKTDRLRERWPGAEFIALPDCIVMPGLVNAHQHGRGVSQIQLGYRDDFLETWIASRRGRGILDAYAVTRLAGARMLAQGVTTTIHANYSYGSGNYEAEVRAQLAAYDEVGIRVAMCVGAMDRGTVVYPPQEACFMAGLPVELKAWLARPGTPAYAGGAESTIALMGRLRTDFGGDSGIRLCYGPAGPQWVSDELMSALARDADANGLGLHLHALESPAQRAAAGELFPSGVFTHLRKLGALNERTVIAHGVWVNDADLAELARAGATVARNAGCNLRLRNGIAPLARYLAHGVRVAVGTDNAALDDNEDLLSELRLAGCLGREPDWNGAASPTTDQLLAMATVNGAVAAQFAPDVGTLEIGKRADLVAVSLERTRSPYLDPDMPLLDAFLARAQGSDVRLTMVEGRIRYRDGRLVGLDLESIEQAAAAAAASARRPLDPLQRDRAAQLHDHLFRHYQQVTAGKPSTASP